MRGAIIDQLDADEVQRHMNHSGLTDAEEMAEIEAMMAYGSTWVVEPAQVLDHPVVDEEMRGTHYVWYGLGSGIETPNASHMAILF